jgi:hypothetical protein
MAEIVLRDFALGADGDLVALAGPIPDLAVVEGLAAVAQRCAVRLRTIKGECAYDLDQGVDYAGVLGKKGVSLGRIKAELQSVVSQTPGVQAIRSLDLTIDPSTRHLTVGFSAQAGIGLATASVPLLEV